MTGAGMADSGLKITLGFMPLVDAALLVVAKEEGFAAAEGLELTLVREGSWAAIRDKLNVGLFDAAHMLAPAAIASTLGLGHLHVPLVAPIALNLDGNAITVSRPLAEALKADIGAPSGPVGSRDSAAALARLVAARRAAGQEPLTIGVVFTFSCHLYQVRRWLAEGGLDPDRDVRFVVIPPPLMVESLSAGLIDLFCAGAPWNRMAEIAGAGHVLHPCAEITPGLMEKVLVLREDRAASPWVGPLIRALARAAMWASEAEHRAILARHLARPDYVGAPASVIAAILAGEAPTLFPGSGGPWLRLDLDATRPSLDRLRSVFEMMAEAGQFPAEPHLWNKAAGLMRGDAYQRAMGGPPSGR
jgi:NitT/TauT family transport system ATP-binding protein